MWWKGRKRKKIISQSISILNWIKGEDDFHYYNHYLRRYIAHIIYYADQWVLSNSIRHLIQVIVGLNLVGFLVHDYIYSTRHVCKEYESMYIALRRERNALVSISQTL